MTTCNANLPPYFIIFKNKYNFSKISWSCQCPPRQEVGHHANIALAIKSLVILMKDVNLKPLSVHHLITNCNHPLIQCLIGSDGMTVAHCSNAMVGNEDDSFNKRPDCIIDVYEQYEFSHITVFGEIKVESAKDLGKIIDFYRLGIFGKQDLENYFSSGVLLFQSIGTNITFYYLTSYGGFLT